LRFPNIFVIPRSPSGNTRQPHISTVRGVKLFPTSTCMCSHGFRICTELIGYRASLTISTPCLRRHRRRYLPVDKPGEALGSQLYPLRGLKSITIVDLTHKYERRWTIHHRSSYHLQLTWRQIRARRPCRGRFMISGCQSLSIHFRCHTFCG